MIRLASAALLLLALAPATAAAEERRYMLTSFDAVRVEGPYEVTITTGGSTGAVAVGDGRAFDTIEVRVESRTLVVRAGQRSWGGFPDGRGGAPRLNVTVPALRTASVQGGGKLSVDRMAAQRVDLRLIGAGSITVAEAVADQVEASVVGTGSVTIGGRGERGRFSANGAGTIDASALTLTALWVNWQSVGEARFTARNTAEVVAQGLGPVIVGGDPACKVIGAGPVRCGRNVVQR